MYASKDQLTCFASNSTNKVLTGLNVGRFKG